MNDQKNLRVILTAEADSTILDILKNNGLEETDEEYFNKSVGGGEPRFMIIRDAALVIFQKKIPEGKIVDLLQKHLEVPKKMAEKIVDDIKDKLLPILEIHQDEKFDDPTFRENISKKVFGRDLNEPIIKVIKNEEKLPPGVKKVEVKDVDENAKIIQKGKKFADEPKKVITEEKVKKIGSDKFANEKKGADSYREPIE